MTLDEAIIEVRDLLDEVQTNDPTAYNDDFLTAEIVDGVDYMADRLPLQLAGNLISRQLFTITTAARTQVPSTFNRFVSLKESATPEKLTAKLVDYDTLQGYSDHRAYGRYGVAQTSLYCAMDGDYIVLWPAPIATTYFYLRYRRTPTAPISGSHSLDLPQERFCKLACMYAATYAVMAKGNLNKTQALAGMFNSAARSMGLRAMYLDVDVADTRKEQQEAKETV